MIIEFENIEHLFS